MEVTRVPPRQRHNTVVATVTTTCPQLVGVDSSHSQEEWGSHCSLWRHFTALRSWILSLGSRKRGCDKRKQKKYPCLLLANGLYVHHCDFKATADCFVDASSEHGPMVLVYALSDRNVVRPRHVPSTVDIFDDRVRPALSVVMLAGSLRSWYMNSNTLCVSCGLLVSRG